MIYYQTMNSPKSRKPPTRIMKIGGTALPRGYASFLADLKTRIRSAQIKASLAVNSELIILRAFLLATSNT